MYLKVRVKAKQKNESLEFLDNQTAIISVKEKPQNNQANQRIIAILKKHFQNPDGGIHIINGHHSPIKLLRIGKD